MASITKRNSKYAVVYYYVDEKGEKRQRWGTFDTHKEDLRRKNEVDYQLDIGTYLSPTSQTVSEFLEDFVSLYGEGRWALNTYDSNTGLVRNYINPHIGTMKIQDITPMFIDQFYKTLQKTKPVSTKMRKAKGKYVSIRIVEKVHKLLKCAFKQAVRWELIQRNPFDLAIVQRPKYQPRDMWGADTIRKALDECRDSKLYIAMNLAFACSMREGEICGLTWDNVHITDDDIGADNAYVHVDKELQRCSQYVIEKLEKKDVIFVFPTQNPRQRPALC